jgi:hypothetical protein
MAIRSHGIITATVIATEINLSPPWSNISVYCGKFVSRYIMSLENLVTILPIGFESKNKIFAFITMFAI